MLTKRKKLSKKQIKEDKLVTTYYKAYGYIQENMNRLAIYAGVLVVVILAVVLYANNKAKNNDLAGTELARTMNSYDGGNYLEAIEGRAGTKLIGLKKIVSQYGSTENGEIAKIYIANAYSNLGKLDEANKYYQDYNGSNKLFKATALAGQASYLAYKKDYEKAADLYKKAAFFSKEDVLNPEYLLQAGINYMAAGKNSDAKELFDKIKKDYATSTAVREIDKYTLQLEQ
jgi:tetratricopeptide (TPR) repeat protein